MVMQGKLDLKDSRDNKDREEMTVNQELPVLQV